MTWTFSSRISFCISRNFCLWRVMAKWKCKCLTSYSLDMPSCSAANSSLWSKWPILYSYSWMDFCTSSHRSKSLFKRASLLSYIFSLSAISVTKWICRHISWYRSYMLSNSRTPSGLISSLAAIFLSSESSFMSSSDILGVPTDSESD